LSISLVALLATAPAFAQIKVSGSVLQVPNVEVKPSDGPIMGVNVGAFDTAIRADKGAIAVTFTDMEPRVCHVRTSEYEDRLDQSWKLRCGMLGVIARDRKVVVVSDAEYAKMYPDHY
jgi:hypothetical protein